MGRLGNLPKIAQVDREVNQELLPLACTGKMNYHEPPSPSLQAVTCSGGILVLRRYQSASVPGNVV